MSSPFDTLLEGLGSVQSQVRQGLGGSIMGGNSLTGYASLVDMLKAFAGGGSSAPGTESDPMQAPAARMLPQLTSLGKPPQAPAPVPQRAEPMGNTQLPPLRRDGTPENIFSDPRSEVTGVDVQDVAPAVKGPVQPQPAPDLPTDNFNDRFGAAYGKRSAVPSLDPQRVAYYGLVDPQAFEQFLTQPRVPQQGEPEWLGEVHEFYKNAITGKVQLAGDVRPLPIQPGPNAGPATGAEISEGWRQGLPRVGGGSDYSSRIRDRLVPQRIADTGDELKMGPPPAGRETPLAPGSGSISPEDQKMLDNFMEMMLSRDMTPEQKYRLGIQLLKDKFWSEGESLMRGERSGPYDDGAGNDRGYPQTYDRPPIDPRWLRQNEGPYNGLREFNEKDIKGKGSLEYQLNEAPRPISDKRNVYESFPEIPAEDPSVVAKFNKWRSKNTVPKFENPQEVERWVRRHGEAFVGSQDAPFVKNLPADIDVQRIQLDKRNPHSTWLYLRVMSPIS